MSLVGRIVGGGSRVRGEDTLWIREVFVGAGASAGGTVTVDRALHLDTVFAAVRLRATTVGKLPLKTYQRTARGRREVPQDPAYRLLHTAPNPEMSAVTVWTLMETHLSTWGNGFVGKEFKGNDVVALWPMSPDRMRVIRKDGRKLFIYRDESGLEHEYTTGDVIHFMGLSLDGLTGLSPIGYAREVVASGLAGEQFTGTFYDNSAVPRGVLEVPGELTPAAAERLKKSWDNAHRGIKNMHRLAVLEGGVKFNPISMPLEDAQFVDQQKLGVQKVARIMGIPPESIGGESGGSLTYSTVEGQNINLLTNGVSWDLACIEQGLARDQDLFPLGDRYPEFLVDAMLRADMKTRAEVYAKALDPATGWMNRDEVRERENLDPEDNAPAPVELGVAARDAMAHVLSEIRAAREATATNGGAHV